MSAAPPAAPARCARQLTGQARMNPVHRANASAPLHASVTSTGNADVPNSPSATAACIRVNGSTACASIQLRRSRPKRPRLHATPCSANLTALVRPWAVSVGTGDLLHGDMSGAEGSAELLDGRQTLEPGRAREDVDVHRAGLGPGVQDCVRLAEDQDAGEAGLGKRM